MSETPTQTVAQTMDQHGLRQSLRGLARSLPAMPLHGGEAVRAQPAARPAAHAPIQPRLLARHAETLLWLGRYMERLENLARLLDVTRTFAQYDGDGRNWLAILRINSDEDRFRAAYDRVTAETVARFYLLDGANFTSIRSIMAQARENARTLRALISTELWLQINVLHGQVHAFGEAEITPQNLSTTCATLRDAGQAHAGIADGTFYRDQTWSFYVLGRHLERADQTTRLVDIKYAAMLPDGGGLVDAAQWDVLLRAAAGYHSYRRVYPHGYSAADVAGFLLLDGAFPRSVGLNLSQIYWHLTQLRSRYGLRGGSAALERLESLRGILASTPIEARLRRGLPDFLDWTQRQIAQVQDDIAAGFFRG